LKEIQPIVSYLSHEDEMKPYKISNYTNLTSGSTKSHQITSTNTLQFIQRSKNQTQHKTEKKIKEPINFIHKLKLETSHYKLKLETYHTLERLRKNKSGANNAVLNTHFLVGLN
jgi:hypothetical protein